MKLKETILMNQKGMVLPLIIVMASIFIIFGVSLITWAITEYKDTLRKVKKVQSLQVAEAGINYYKWHLAHDSSDYKDGNTWCCDEGSIPEKTLLSECGGKCGPYVHEYRDYNNSLIGEFSLYIIPPEAGSTVNTIESAGNVYGSNSIQKKITSLIGKRSLAEYSFLTNAPIWIGDSESTVGPLHSNGGIRFDGTCTAEVTNSVSAYDCAGTGHGCSGTKPGIWGAGGPNTYWRYPVPAIDFDLFTVSLADIKTEAISDGIYYDDSGADGYLIKFETSPSIKIDIYRVDSLEAKVWYYNTEQGGWKKEAEEIQNKTFLDSLNIPNNGLVFIEDDIWVEGTLNGKVTLAAARFPENPNNYAKIRINNNIQYVARDGSNNLGLMAQGDILVPRYAPDDLVIDAVLLSQKGHVYYRHYNSHSIKNSIEVYGSIITNLFWTWTWVGGGGATVDGYNATNTIYNNNLTFSPPPSFPTSENFEILSWTEE